jgi:HAD superfamily hydrolase (TIGR01490 family)
MLGPRSKYKNSAAFYDVDGTLIKINIVHAFAYYQARHPSLLESAMRTIKTGASIPVFWAADKLSRKWFNEIFYRQYEGASEDRLVVLAEELFEDVIKPNIYPRAKDLIEDSRRAGVRQVLISGALDFTMKPLARYLGVDDLIANRLEFVDHYATGKLQKPFVAGATKADIMRAYAKEHAIDLAESWAYTDSFSDYPMLAVVGHPTACNPDFRLRSLARSYDWPVLDLDEEPERAASRRPQGLARLPRQIRRQQENDN